METVNALWPAKQKTHPPYTHQNFVKDPLTMLRCDTRVFRYMGETDSHKLKKKFLLFYYRCPAIFEIL